MLICRPTFIDRRYHQLPQRRVCASLQGEVQLSSLENNEQKHQNLPVMFFGYHTSHTWFEKVCFIHESEGGRRSGAVPSWFSALSHLARLSGPRRTSNIERIEEGKSTKQHCRCWKGSELINRSAKMKNGFPFCISVFSVYYPLGVINYGWYNLWEDNNLSQMIIVLIKKYIKYPLLTQNTLDHTDQNFMLNHCCNASYKLSLV